LPDKRDLPDYYSTITNPISLQEIEVGDSAAPWGVEALGRG
jgi:hypothetical protein